MTNDAGQFDILVIGGGPGGSVAAIRAAQLGLSVCVLEKASHPRFHIGESMLPQMYSVLKKLGLVEAIWKLPHVDKLGAEFILGDGNGGPATFEFINGLVPGELTCNIERSVFDAELLRQAELAGATVRQNTAVDEIVRLNESDVAVRCGDETIVAKYLLDCSGQNTVVGRHLKTRRAFDEPELQKVAYFAHFDRVERLPGKQSGYPSIVMCKEGWFWIIGLNEVTTSIGFVTRPEFAKQLNVPADRLLVEVIERTPVMKHRTRNCTGNAIETGKNHVASNFSYRCDAFAGPGYFLVGDAAAFLDPIFSTGVLLAMHTGMQASEHVKKILDGQIAPAAARSQYTQFFNGGTAVFWRLIRSFYQHSFRELFLNQQGPWQMHRAVSAILGGYVFPRPAWKLTWRLWLFHASVFLQRHVQLVPRRKPFSLLDEPAAERCDVGAMQVATV